MADVYWEEMREFQRGKKYPLQVSDMMSQSTPLCWRYLETERVCIKEMGHDDGIHESKD